MSNVKVQHKPDKSIHIYVGPHDSHSHTVISSDGRLVYDRGVGPDGRHIVFTDDQGRGIFNQTPVIPTNPPPPLLGK